MPSGNPTGVGVDMAHALATYLHRPIAHREHAVRGADPGAEDGPDRPDHFVDDGDRRAAQVDRFFRSLPQHRPGDPGEEEQPDPRHRRRGQAGHDRGGEDGHDQRQLRARPFQERDGARLQQDTACALEVVQGKADAFLYDQMSIYQFAKKNPDTTRGLARAVPEGVVGHRHSEGQHRSGERR